VAKNKKTDATETVEEMENKEEVDTAEEVTEESVEEKQTEDVDSETDEDVVDDEKDPRDELIDALTDKYKRTFAEFDNFRKRSEKEKATMFDMGVKSVAEKILPVVDSFERGLLTVGDDADSAFAVGMDKVYKQFVKALEDAGITPIEALGKEFDPEFHNAVMHVDDENLGENIVAEELQKGYMLHDTVLRHSMVKVAN